ncbi:hypothetical protein SAMN04489806_2591 [Paramicrobacterium humi]|uniref:Tetratricopeptide repeat-containing protein n=1 Tax=Paramicrobacterium humi TaxID=640635 RepID=A0A1H4PR60_9MICO|nr:hypothetical protein [Microbacterium humi]SEC09923.1 hypothetical protein SAMN04489806_2591 [Microbacterium humi]
MSTRVGVAVMAVLLVLYLVLIGQRAVMFVLTGEPAAVGIGVALIILPIVGAWGLWRELKFGIDAERLARELERTGGLPDEQLPLKPSGAVERDAADAVFPRYKADVEAQPDSWQAWYRLGLAYKGAGDGRRARHAVRTAIRLHAAH